jgi:hypothetical protein
MKTRLKASGIHFLLSLIIVSAVLCFFAFVWYPAPLFALQDLYKVVITLVGVDIILGPLLTFIVFNPQKKGLKLDLLVIGIIQISALSYGVYTSYISRPIYVVFCDGRFNSVTANEYAYLDLKKISPDNPYLKLSLTGPTWLGAVKPDKLSQAEEMDLDFSTALGDGLRVMPQHYVPYEKVKSDVIKASKPASSLDLSEEKLIERSKTLKKLEKGEPSLEQVRSLKRWLLKINLPMEKIGLVTIKGRENYAIIAIDLVTAEVIDSVSIDPWWYQ